jgi:hypothetical protein
VRELAADAAKGFSESLCVGNEDMSWSLHEVCRGLDVLVVIEFYRSQSMSAVRVCRI